MASSSLQRTNSGANNKKWTVSLWVKMNKYTGDGGIFDFYTDTSNRFNIYANPQFKLRNLASGSYVEDLEAKWRLRDPACWYNIVVKSDTAQATNSDRFVVYVNGVALTADDYDSLNYPAQDSTYSGNIASATLRIGRYDSNYSDMNFAHFHYCDGYAYDATSFGDFDSTTGIWKPKGTPSVSYGTNGVFLKFENNAALGTDSSGNGNTWSTVGTPTKTSDTPSENFATFLSQTRDRAGTLTQDYLSNGGTTVSNTGSSSGTYVYPITNLGVTKGKYYWECKPYTSSETGMAFGIAYTSILDNNSAQFWDDSAANGIMINRNSSNGYYAVQSKSGGGNWTSTVTMASSDVVGLALDMDNQAFYAHVNGTYLNSGDPTSGASQTGSLLSAGTISSGTQYVNSGEPVHATGCCVENSNKATMQFNFGNGFFATTAISSAGTGPTASGGTFEYDCPAGYQALSTKGMNSF